MYSGGKGMACGGLYTDCYCASGYIEKLNTDGTTSCELRDIIDGGGIIIPNCPSGTYTSLDACSKCTYGHKASSTTGCYSCCTSSENSSGLVCLKCATNDLEIGSTLPDVGILYHLKQQQIRLIITRLFCST